MYYKLGLTLVVWSFFFCAYLCTTENFLCSYSLIYPLFYHLVLSQSASQDASKTSLEVPIFNVKNKVLKIREKGGVVVRNVLWEILSMADSYVCVLKNFIVKIHLLLFY